MTKIQIGDATISVFQTERKMPNGQPYWRWTINTGEVLESSDVAWTGTGEEMMGTMCSFLAMCAETLQSGETEGAMFPESLHEWVRENASEIRKMKGVSE